MTEDTPEFTDILAITSKMGCGSSMDSFDEPKTVVVFGATGLLGGSVARALLNDPFKFRVRCVTRKKNSDKARELAELGTYGAVIVNANLDDTKSLEKALANADAMFLTTHFWEEKNKQKEIVQGLNAIDAAVSCGVSHIIFNGSENVKKLIGRDCNHLDSKFSIEEYIREVGRAPTSPDDEDKTLGLNYTILRLPFWYENFYTVFKPYKLKYGVYALALPLEDGALDCMAVEDVGECVYDILCKPRLYYGKTLGLCADRLSLANVVDIFNKHFDTMKFKDPKMKIRDYENFKFSGAKDLAAMFEFYKDGTCVRDIKLTKKLNSRIKSFDKWMDENKDYVEEAIRVDEELDQA
ncbi:nmrA-like family domain-containing protein 1 isoform X3 [Mizuhopecten yessoensis]|uniref:nmrA-like family domain-containing protein 1 isoform X3 n=1 Tax=Mizuhopecten yessoensis TaxID=6573 RepID=UPI000B45C26A|nr:nmrA-like family domain-containing protein 1 isoform X3 [Mizuhopecten yessoensis]